LAALDAVGVGWRAARAKDAQIASAAEGLAGRLGFDLAVVGARTERGAGEQRPQGG
jgi:hypothetical protein